MGARNFIHASWLGVFTMVLCASLMAQGKLLYPPPAYPELMEVRSAEDLLDIARVIVNRPSRESSGFAVGWGIQPGQRVLLAPDSSFDRRVVTALEMAIREAGAKVDVIFLDYHSFFPPMKPAEAAKELDYFLFLSKNALRSKIFIKNFVQAVAEYHVVIHGTGGGNPQHAGFRWEKIPWQTLDEFISGTANYPADIVEALDRKTWNTLLKARRVRVTDPEGTDISWTVKLEDRGEHPERIRGRGHIGAHPPFNTKSILDAEGVIAGSSNHTGFFPRIKIYISKNNITRIESGGRYGENWKAVLEEYKDIQWPGAPGPGMGWLHEVAIGTNPKSSRPANIMLQPSRIGSWERSRSGVIHWGIGVQGDRKWALENNMPDGHFHVHTYFNTFELQTDDGEWVKLIDKGHLTALDAPEIRELAAQYGDPDEILKEAWVPAIPGINVEGDYQRDFAIDPGSWIKMEHEKIYGDWLKKHY